MYICFSWSCVIYEVSNLNIPFFFCSFVYLFVSLSIHLSYYLSFSCYSHLYNFLSLICMFVSYLFIYLSIYQFIYIIVGYVILIYFYLFQNGCYPSINPQLPWVLPSPLPNRSIFYKAILFFYIKISYYFPPPPLPSFVLSSVILSSTLSSSLTFYLTNVIYVPSLP